jgi:hypothetical protein
VATKIGICNTALTLIGADEINSFEDDTTEASVTERLYASIVNDVSSRYPWRFLVPQTELSRELETPDLKWDAAYQIPPGTDLIRGVFVNDAPIEFDRHGDLVLCNAAETDSVFMEHTLSAVGSEAVWPGYFTAVIELELAAAIAVPIGDRPELSDFYTKKGNARFAIARSADAQGRTTKKLRVSRFRSARMGA